MVVQIFIHAKPYCKACDLMKNVVQDYIDNNDKKALPNGEELIIEATTIIYMSETTIEKQNLQKGYPLTHINSNFMSKYIIGSVGYKHFEDFMTKFIDERIDIAKEKYMIL